MPGAYPLFKKISAKSKIMIEKINPEKRNALFFGLKNKGID
jgi:hypothetical protein